MATYYVSNGGNDSNNGLSPTNAWKTLAKVKTFSFSGGDKILLKRNNVFDERLTFDAPSFTNEVIIGAYGKGNKPKITGYKRANNISLWTQHATNIWKVDLSLTGGTTGNKTDDANVGFLNIDDTIYGRKKAALTDLTIGTNVKQWDFYSDTTAKILYVYSTQNPASLVNNIEIAINVTLINKRNNITIQDLEVTGTGGHGVGNAGNDVKINNCKVHACGGSYLPGYGTGTTRFGNGIEFFLTGERVEVEYNEIYDCYDVAFTVQGQGGTGFEDVMIRYNVIYNCTQSFEIWTRKSTDGTITPKLKNIIFEHNFCINAGYGWGYDVRPDQGTDVHILLYNIETPISEIDVKVNNNIYYNPRGALYYGSANLGYTIPYQANNNKIFLREGQKIHKNYNYTVEQHEDFSQVLGVEKNSDFYILTDVAETTEEIMSNISSYLGVASEQMKNIQKSVGRLTSKINESAALIQGISYKNTGEITEFPHLTGFVKPVGGYVTNSVSTVGNSYAPLLKVKIKSSYNVRFDTVLFYMIGGDSYSNRHGTGFLSLQISPATNFAVGTYVDVEVREQLEFPTISTYTRNDFVAVVEKEDGTSVEVGLYFNVGKDNWTKLTFFPMPILTNGVIGTDEFTFYNKASLLSSLPSGTTYRSSNASEYVKAPTTGTGSPTITPARLGDEYIDTSTTPKKYYKAVGTTSSSDWIALN